LRQCVVDSFGESGVGDHAAIVNAPRWPHGSWALQAARARRCCPDAPQ
jgi:hypothetical protein